uniref:Cytochrome c domain-containing protein n=1 Tax=Tanacetum cinerariifolium TaxID=118510 RepID=A0A699GER2_TANCI|nr:hypothetical protein [Tanacetum cinerariifolium]
MTLPSTSRRRLLRQLVRQLGAATAAAAVPAAATPAWTGTLAAPVMNATAATAATVTAVAADRQPLRMAVLDQMPWAGRNDQGRPAGVVVDMARLLATASGTAIDTIALPYARAAAMLAHGKVDLMLAIDTGTLAGLPAPLDMLGGEDIVIVGRHGSGYRSLDDLCGRTLRTGTAHADAAAARRHAGRAQHHRLRGGTAADERRRVRRAAGAGARRSGAVRGAAIAGPGADRAPARRQRTAAPPAAVAGAAGAAPARVTIPCAARPAWTGMSGGNRPRYRRCPRRRAAPGPAVCRPRRAPAWPQAGWRRDAARGSACAAPPRGAAQLDGVEHRHAGQARKAAQHRQPRFLLERYKLASAWHIGASQRSAHETQDEMDLDRRPAARRLRDSGGVDAGAGHRPHRAASGRPVRSAGGGARRARGGAGRLHGVPHGAGRRAVRRRPAPAHAVRHHLHHQHHPRSGNRHRQLAGGGVYPRAAAWRGARRPPAVSRVPVYPLHPHVHPGYRGRLCVPDDAHAGGGDTAAQPADLPARLPPAAGRLESAVPASRALGPIGGERSPAFGGGHIDGWDAPALTALLHAPRPWTEQQLALYLRHGWSAEHGAAAGPMAPVAHSLSQVPQEDTDAIAHYIMSLQDRRAPAAPSAPTDAADATDASRGSGSAAAISQGRQLFAGACAGCHGAAAPMMAAGGRPSLALSGAVTGARPDNLIQTVLNGLPWTHTGHARPGPTWASALPGSARRTSHDHPYREWPTPCARYRSRHAAAVRAAQPAGTQRRQVRLRPGTVRRLHRAAGRPAGIRLPDARRRVRRPYRTHHRGPGHGRATGAAAGIVHQAPGGAVRLLHRRHGDARAGAARTYPQADRGANPGPHGTEPLPLRHPHAHPGRDTRGGRRGRGLHRKGRPGMNVVDQPVNHGRRAVLRAGALVISFTLLPQARAEFNGMGVPPVANPDLPGSLSRTPMLDAWIRIAPDGKATVFTGKVELGTGVRTALLQVAAEQLDLAPSAIEFVTADTGRTPNEGFTAGSHTMADSGTALLHAAAQVRSLLVQGAAARLKVPASQLVTRNGIVTAPDGRHMHYGEALQGIDLHRMAQVTSHLKSPGNYSVMGASLPRVDIPAKLTGGAAYVQDMRPAGMVHARVVRPPAPGARLLSADIDGVRGMAGVVKVVGDGNYLAVVARDEWQAVLAMRALSASARWAPGPALPQADNIHDTLRALPAQHITIADRHGATDAAAITVKARYSKQLGVLWPERRRRRGGRRGADRAGHARRAGPGATDARPGKPVGAFRARHQLPAQRLARRQRQDLRLAVRVVERLAQRAAGQCGQADTRHAAGQTVRSQSLATDAHAGGRRRPQCDSAVRAAQFKSGEPLPAGHAAAHVGHALAGRAHQRVRDRKHDGRTGGGGPRGPGGIPPAAPGRHARAGRDPARGPPVRLGAAPAASRPRLRFRLRPVQEHHGVRGAGRGTAPGPQHRRHPHRAGDGGRRLRPGRQPGRHPQPDRGRHPAVVQLDAVRAVALRSRRDRQRGLGQLPDHALLECAGQGGRGADRPARHAAAGRGRSGAGPDGRRAGQRPGRRRGQRALHEGGERACLGTGLAPAREHRPQVHRRQLPAGKQAPYLAGGQFRGEHPFARHCHAHVRQHGGAHAFGGGNAQPAGQRHVHFLAPAFRFAVKRACGAAAATVVEHRLVVGQLGRVARLAVPGQVFGRGHHRARTAGQAPRGHGGVAERAQAQRHVGAAFQQIHVGIVQHQVERQFGVLVQEGRQVRHDVQPRKGDRRARHQPAGQARAHAARALLGVGGGIERAARALIICQSRFGGRQAPARAQQQLHAQFRLQLRDQFGDRRLAHVQPPGGAREGARFHDVDQGVHGLPAVHRLHQRGIVGVAALRAAIERVRIGRVVRAMGGDARHQVRIGDVRATECHHVGLPGGHHGLRRLRRQAGIGDQHAAIIGAHDLEDLGHVRRAAPGVGVGGVNVADAELRQHARHVGVRLRRVRVAGVVIGRKRRDAHAHAVGGHHLEHRFDHQAQEARAVFHAAAEFVGAAVDVRRQELLHQVAVGRMDFHAVEARARRVGRAGAKLGDGRVHLAGGHRPRRRRRDAGVIAVAQRAVHLQLSEVVVDGRWRQRVPAVQQRVGADPAAMPQLHEDLAAGRVHRVGHLAPTAHLRFRINAGRQFEGGGVGRNVGGLGDDQPRRGALAVVGGVERGGYAAVAGAGARDGRHGDAVGKGKVAEGDGVEQSGHGRAPKNFDYYRLLEISLSTLIPEDDFRLLSLLEISLSPPIPEDDFRLLSLLEISLLPPRGRRVVPRVLSRGDRSAAARLAADPVRPVHPDRGAHRLRQDAHRVPGRHRRPGAGKRAPWRGRAARRNAGAVRVAAKGAVQRHPRQPAGAPGRHRSAAGCHGPAAARHPHRRAHRRHHAGRAQRHAAPRAAHPGVHARVAVRAAGVGQRARHAGRRAHRDRRRDPRGGRQQAWQPPVPEPGAARRAVPRPAGARGPVGHAKAAVHGVGARVRQAGGAHRPAPHHAGVRQHAAHGRAHGAPPGRPPGRGARGRAPRQPVQGIPARRRAAPEARRPAGAGRHRVAGAGHRHRRRRPGMPDRLPAQHRVVPAARGPLGPPGGWPAQGPAVSHVARRPGGMRGAARLPDRGRSGVPRMVGRRPVRADTRRLAVREPGARALRRSAAHAGRRLHHAPGRARFVPAPRHRLRHAARTARRQAHGRHLGRHHPRQRRLLGGARTARPQHRHRARGLCGGKPGRRRLPAREHLVPHPAHRRRQGAGGGCPRRRAQHPVLAGRGAGPQRRAVVRRGAPARRDRPPARPSRRRKRRHRGIPGPRPQRPDRPAHARYAGDGALLRRIGRHAAGAARAVRQPHQPRVGTGAAQALLPHLQLRAAGRRHRGCHRALAVGKPQLPARRGVALPAFRHRRTYPGAGAARRAAVQRAVALERHHGAGPAALRGRAQGGAAIAAHEKRRPAGLRLPRPGGVPGKHRGRARTAEPPAGGPDARRLPARGDGQRRLAGPAAAHGSGRSSHQPPLDRSRFHRRPGRARYRRHRGRGAGSVARRAQRRRNARSLDHARLHRQRRSGRPRGLERLAAGAGQGRTRHPPGQPVGGARTPAVRAGRVSRHRAQACLDDARTGRRRCLEPGLRTGGSTARAPLRLRSADAGRDCRPAGAPRFHRHHRPHPAGEPGLRDAWPVYARRNGGGMGGAPPAGPHPPLHHQAPAARDRAGGTPGLHALPVRLAAPVGRHAPARAGCAGAGAGPARRVPGSGRRLGAGRAGAARGGLRTVLARRAVPRRQDRLDPRGRAGQRRRRPGARHAAGAAAAPPAGAVARPARCRRRGGGVVARRARAGRAAARRRHVLRRAGAGRAPAAGGAGNRAGRTGGHGPGQCRQLRGPARHAGARRQAQYDGQAAPPRGRFRICAGDGRSGPLGAGAPRRRRHHHRARAGNRAARRAAGQTGGTAPAHRSRHARAHRHDAAAPLRRDVLAPARARGRLDARVARAAARVPPARSARRDTRRTVCRRPVGRTVRPARGHSAAARHAPARARRRLRVHLGHRSAQPVRHPAPRRQGAGAGRQPGAPDPGERELLRAQLLSRL